MNEILAVLFLGIQDWWPFLATSTSAPLSWNTPTFGGNFPWTPTCKGATEHDLILLSPAALAVCTGFYVEDGFADRNSVMATLAVTESPAKVLTWPRPREIPWNDVDIQGWHEHCSSCVFEPPADSTAFMTQFTAL